MLPDFGAIEVGRLVVRGPEDAAMRLRRRLTEAEIAPPPDGEREFVFVRRLALAGAGDVARQLERALGPAVADPGAVRFATRAQLFAALIADLLAGRARARWYWRRFARLLDLSPGDALAEILAAFPLEAGALAASLDAAGALPAAWRALAEESAAALAGAIARAAGLPAPATRREGAGAGGRFHLQPIPAAPIAVRPPAGDASPLRLPPAVVARWRPALAGLAPEAPQARLAALIVLLELAPPLLMRDDATRFLAKVADVLTGAAPLDDDRPRPATDAAAGPSSAAVAEQTRVARRPSARRTADQRGAPRSARVAEAEAPARTTKARPGSPGRGDARREVIRPPPAAESSTTRPSPPRADAEPAPVAAASGPDVVATRFAGTFHLVNALERLGLARRLAAACDASPSAGWRLLRDLAAGLGLDSEDPLAAFLAARIAEAEALGGDAPPDAPHPLAAALAADAAAFYGRFEVWDLGLIAVPGLIEATPTHLEIVLPASRIRLAVRRAGLDLDPGWVRWLGRVVTFVYEGFGDTAPGPGGRA